MAQFISSPSIIKAAGNLPKVIKEYIGRVNSKTNLVSLAHMQSPAGWTEPGQTPEFDEYTLVLKGQLHVKTNSGEWVVQPGQAIVISNGEWVQYSSPEKEGAEYIAVCNPAFSLDTVHRDS